MRELSLQKNVHQRRDVLAIGRAIAIRVASKARIGVRRLVQQHRHEGWDVERVGDAIGVDVAGQPDGNLPQTASRAAARYATI